MADRWHGYAGARAEGKGWIDTLKSHIVKYSIRRILSPFLAELIGQATLAPTPLRSRFSRVYPNRVSPNMDNV